MIDPSVPHDVFISYASADKTAADAICSHLESTGINCWIAPRDIVPGVPWAESIVDAIESARVMVLVFSEASNKSVQVMREVERSVNKDVPVIPIRIQNATPSRTMEYFISATHWFDAIDPPLERHMDRLVHGLHALLARRNGSSGVARAPVVHEPQLPSPPPAAAAPPAAAPPPAPPAAVSTASQPAVNVQASSIGEIPSTLGSYEVGHFLTNGRFGSIVHAGTHRLLGHPVAIRIFRPSANRMASAVRERFLKEARAMQVTHPNIIHVRDFGEVGDLMYVVTDLLAGCSLSEALAKEGPLPAPRLFTFVRELVDATAAVQRQNGLIAGLNPDMIRVVQEPDGSERLAISSAGVSAAHEMLSVMNDQSLRAQTTAHELFYIAPEVLMGKPADQRTDVFTIGVLAYQMATGSPPYAAPSYPELIGAMLGTTPADLATVRPDLAPAAAATIMQCLASDPQKRLANAAEVLAAWSAAGQP